MCDMERCGVVFGVVWCGVLKALFPGGVRMAMTSCTQENAKQVGPISSLYPRP